MTWQRILKPFALVQRCFRILIPVYGRNMSCMKWQNTIERAIKAEALAWELVAALRRISEILDSATCRCRCGFCEYFNAQKRADKALAKAKKVLGDEATTYSIWLPQTS